MTTDYVNNKYTIILEIPASVRSTATQYTGTYNIIVEGIPAKFSDLIANPLHSIYHLSESYQITILDCGAAAFELLGLDLVTIEASAGGFADTTYYISSDMQKVTKHN